MRNLKPTHLSAVGDHSSAVSDILDRVVTIAPAPLLPGEKQADYADVAVRIVRAAKPRDAIEEFLIRDVVDLTWEILRLRRLKAGLLRASIDNGVREVMDSLGYGEGRQYGYVRELAGSWAAGEKSAKKEVAIALEKAQLTIEDVMAKTLDSKIESFERFDRMLASAEARRNNALREVDRHRSALGGAVRHAIDETRTRNSMTSRPEPPEGGTLCLTTDRERRANRANAKSSTGPKTAPGKARSAQNALRHGLNVTTLSDPVLAPLAEAMARRRARQAPDAGALDRARRIAEAQVDINRVRGARRRLITGLLTDPKYQPLRVLQTTIPADEDDCIVALERTFPGRTLSRLMKLKSIR